MMELVPAIFIVFKVLVLGVGMFFAIKWHYDQGKKENGKAKQRAVLVAGGKIAALFVVLLLVLLLLTFGLSKMRGLNLSYP